METQEVRILYSESQIQKKIAELAQIIKNDYQDTKPVLIGILKGSVVVLADLLRALYKEGLTDVEIDFMTVSSYGHGKEYSGSSKIISDIARDIAGRDVIIIEDIVDTGHTLRFVQNHLLAKKPKSLKILAFLDKVEKREAEISVDYIGFTLSGTPWVEGYGLDGGKYGRGRPDIAEKILE